MDPASLYGLLLGAMGAYSTASALQGLGLGLAKTTTNAAKGAYWHKTVRKYRNDAAKVLMEELQHDSLEKIFVRFKKLVAVFRLPYSIHIAAMLNQIQRTNKMDAKDALARIVKNSKRMKRIRGRFPNRFTEEDAMNVFRALKDIK